MPLLKCLIELRPNLRTAVVLLHFDGLVTENNSRIEIDEQGVNVCETLENGSVKTQLIIEYNAFGMDIHNITSFIVADNHIYFRFNYNRIDLEALERQSVLVAMKPIELQFKERSAPFALHCISCSAKLVSSCSYGRLREFPHGIVEPADFYCDMARGPVPNALLVPGTTDLFYGLNYIVLKTDVVLSRVGLHDSLIYCGNCLRLLGKLILQGLAARLWADTVHWSLEIEENKERTEKESKVQAAVHHYDPHPIFKYDMITQFMLRLLHCLWRPVMPQLSPISNKVLLWCTLPNRELRKVLLLVLDPDLRVLRRYPPGHESLCGYRACKLYFKILDIVNVNHTYLDQIPWEDQREVPLLEVSHVMFLALVARLELNMETVPEAWRYNTCTEKMLLTYFFYEDEPEEQIIAEQLWVAQQLKKNVIVPDSIDANDEHSDES
ncbi:uncharacterized protein LOC115630745 [Scaptodrosophila lebanonensis]|uniref:Uncharacterized protein LOC115630745 n=1 Tax=Drosophila lebanonensis TaxID=7225 RepID=A0A6J2U4G7_DROLE|nr:uncharacterized protein LOC115630745 [Scaptodrosophila lebanonensis]